MPLETTMRYICTAAQSLLLLALAPTVAMAAPVSPVTVPAAGYVMPVAAGDIVWVQRFLLERGFYTGAVDGISGPKTAAAVRAYEASVGWVVTGNPHVLATKLGYGTPSAPAVVAPAPVVPAPVVPAPIIAPHRPRPHRP